MSNRDPSFATPEDEADGVVDKCMLHDAASIRALLQQAIDKRCTLVATGETGAASVVTAPLAIEDGTFWIDAPRDPDILQRLLRCRRLSLQGVLDRVTLRFSCGPPVPGVRDGLPALGLPLPARLLHLQRRELMRREPFPEPLNCLVYGRDPDDDTAPTSAMIRDIGGGGLAVLTPDDHIALALGDVLPRCAIELPDLGVVDVALRVRHVRHVKQRGKDIRHVGCEFVDLPAAAQAKLFRYLMQLDREQLSRRAASKRDGGD